MAEGSLRLGGLSSGLAVILDGDDQKDNSLKIVSHCDDFGNQSVERTLEYIFDLPNKSIDPLTVPIDRNLIRSIINNEFCGFHMNANANATVTDRDGISIIGGVCGRHSVALDEFSICGDIKICKPPLLVESLAMFSSARANACVWKGKWMYEVNLDTLGIQQLGWATLSCPFTDHNGVGDADDSYAFDGKRVSKWNKKSEPYGQSWVTGDIIGCCIDLDKNEISFYRNGCSLGVAFSGIRKMGPGPGSGYYPAISLSQGERCELNFGSRPFKYPIEGYLPLQAPPSINLFGSQLLQCLSRLLDLQSMEKVDYCLVDKLRRLRRFVPHVELFHPVSHGICDELFSALEADNGIIEYVAWGPFMSFMMEVFGIHAPHDYSSLDRIIDVFLEYQGSRLVFEYIIDALSSGCKTALLVLAECPCTGSYPYLALACHLLRREELMVLWWRSSDFQFLFEGFLSRKIPNREDLQCIMPSIWWPGSCEDVSHESSMALTTSALSESISKIEEKHRDLCRLVIQFTPPVSSPQLPGSVFRTFLQNLLLKNRGADRNMPPSGISSNSVLVSLYAVILHFLSEGFAMGDSCGWLKSYETDGSVVGFLHRGGRQSFPLGLLLKNDPNRADIARLGGSFSHLLKSHPVNDQEAEVIRWEEGCMDDEETKATHSTRLKPCCCSSYDIDSLRISRNPIRYTGKGSRGHCGPISERSAHVARECGAESLNDEIADKPSSSDQPQSEFDYLQLQHLSIIPRESNVYSATLLGEEELLDTMLLLYHIGLAPNFKQASYYMSHQSQSIALLEETDKQIREGACGEQLKRLKEARNGYREEVIDCVRHGAWYRISLFSRWKQRGIYATCMWIVQFLLVISKMDSVFVYVPEFYLEALVDCFHVLRKSDPPYVSSAIFVKQGLSSFVTFVVSHFNDQRISSADLRDLLLQSISVLVQYKEYLVVFESNEVATRRMPKALLLAFDNRSWIPVTNILLRLCKNSGFGSSKHGESSSSSSVFQRLLREACINDEELFSAFLNRLFNTLSWTMTEFSVSIREMQEKYQIEFQQRKCSVIFDLSCNLARVLEFCTSEIPQAFLSRNNTNLRRLTELIVFILNHITSVVDTDLFDVSPRRQGQYLDKLNRGMILAPLVGMIFNILDASEETKCKEQDDIVDVFASMDCPNTVNFGFQYLLNYNWAGSLRGEAHLVKLRKLDEFLNVLICRMASEAERTDSTGDKDSEDNTCCICYASEADAQFKPCPHRSCYGCITRHLLNCQRCFFCNATVLEVFRI